MTPRYWPALCLVLVVYLVLYGSLLIASDGLPYVLDNNESFSNYFHAKNAYDFGWGQTWGLADESFSPHPEAHPYTYTHGGNFSRFYAYALYALGARSIESQIIIYVFTVGILAIFLMFHFFAKTTNARFAVIACLAFMGDYLLFAQWHVCTWRVWHTFFVFSSLLCVHGILESGKRRWWPLIFFNFVALFYYELIFATFVGVITGLYGGWLLYRRPSRLAAAWALQLAGSLTAMAILVGQNIGLLGWEDFKTDLALTFSARNYDPNGNLIIRSFDSLRQFYEGHHLAFWYNVFDTSQVKNLSAFIGSIFQYGFELVTPLISLCALLLVAGWLLSIFLGWCAAMAAKRAKPAPELVEPRSRLFMLGLAIILFTLALISVGTSSYLGPPILAVPSHSSLMQMAPLWVLMLALACSAAVGGTRLSLRSTTGFPMTPRSRAVATVAFLLVAAWFVRWSGGLYNPAASLIWTQALPAWAHIWPSMLSLQVCALLAAGMMLIGHRRLLGSSPRDYLMPAARYIVVALVAYTAVYLASPGYVYSGYLLRYAPLLVFITSPILAVGAYLLLKLCGLAWRLALLRLKIQHRQTLPGQDIKAITGWRSTGLTSMASLGNAAILGLLGLFLAFCWVNVQATHIRLMPPDHMAFLKTLVQPPYRGASFVANAYAAPIAYATNQWAYLDSDDVPNLEITLGDDGYRLSRDYRYLWLADRDENPAYHQPDYYLCFLQQNYYTTIQDLFYLRGNVPNPVTCSTQPIVRQAITPGDSPLNPCLSDIDGREIPVWAIVKLDWEYPPYLAPLAGLPPEQKVALYPRKAGGQWNLVAQYSYKQQQGRPESGTLIDIYTCPAGKPGQTPAPPYPRLRGESGDGRVISIPKDFQGIIRVGVTPASQNKIGREYSSQAWLVPGPGDRPRPASKAALSICRQGRK